MTIPKDFCYFLKCGKTKYMTFTISAILRDSSVVLSISKPLYSRTLELFHLVKQKLYLLDKHFMEVP